MFDKMGPRTWVLCALPTALIAATVYTHTEPAEFSFVLGADMTHAGCKEPCTDHHVRSLIECYHPPGGGDCELDSCYINNMHIAICEEGDPLEGEDPCVTGYDFGDWYRSGRQRDIEPDCVDKGKVSVDLEQCEIWGGLPGWETPCGADECYGMELDYQTAAGREECK